jgi:hypothetical protein
MANYTRRYFPTRTKAELDVWLREVEEEILTGKVNDSWGAGDSSGHKFIDMNLPPERRRDMILNDLTILDPDTYPRATNVPVRRTVPFYYGIAFLHLGGIAVALWAMYEGLCGMTFL